VLLNGLAALFALAALHRDLLTSLMNKIFQTAIGAFLVLSVVLTGSRRGLALLLVAGAGALVMLPPRFLRSRPRAGMAILGALAVLGLAATLPQTTPSCSAPY
jgi:hypothetical protein